MKRFTDKPECKYDLTQLPNDVIAFQMKGTPGEVIPESTKWGGNYPIPQIGDRVTVLMNQLGSGVVESYFVEHGWLGLCVKLDNPPEWKRKQHKGTPGEDVALAFGIEIKAE